MRKTGIVVTIVCLVFSFSSSRAADTVTQATCLSSCTLTYNNATMNNAPYGKLTVAFDAYAARSVPAVAGLGSATIKITKGTTRTATLRITAFGITSTGSGSSLVRTLTAQGVAQEDGACYSFVIKDYYSYTTTTLDYGTVKSSCTDSGIPLYGVALIPANAPTTAHIKYTPTA